MQVFTKNIGTIKQFWCIYVSFIQIYIIVVMLQALSYDIHERPSTSC